MMKQKRIGQKMKKQGLKVKTALFAGGYQECLAMCTELDGDPQACFHGCRQCEVTSK